MNIGIKRNISISYIYNFLLQLNITSAIWVLYLAFKGMSLVEIGILESIYHIAGLLFELPSGAIADLYGKKFCIVIGRIIDVVACVFMITSNSLWGFAIAFILNSTAMSLHSGAAEALVYDSLKELGKEDKYKKIWGDLAFLMSIAQGVAVLIGGILADIKFLYAYMLGMIIQIVAAIVACAYKEPAPYKHKEEQQGKIITDQLRTSILKGILISIVVINILALTGLAFMKELSIVFLLLTSITGGLGFTIFSDYINTRIPSQYRATILSFDSLCFSMFMIGVFPLFGLLAEKIGFSITFGIIAILYIPVMLFLMAKLRKHKNIEICGGISNDTISLK